MLTAAFLTGMILFLDERVFWVITEEWNRKDSGMPTFFRSPSSPAEPHPVNRHRLQMTGNASLASWHGDHVCGQSRVMPNRDPVEVSRGT
jgi:hypothetical protein